jgi:hypothetical protein
MKSTLIRTAIVTSLVTALAVSALALYAVPRLLNSSQNPDGGYTLQPAVYHTQDDGTYSRPRVVHRASYSEPSYSQPVTQVRRHRSTETSVLIVAGSSAAGAGIGALAGGKKGAGIGAIAGGLGGLIYDRATANR